MSHAIAHGDVLACLRELPDNEFDGLFCDPPYGFSFMGKKWDYQVPSVDVWREAYRVLKPGAALLAFGGSRTFHRMAVNIEDAGFELRDCLMWLYGKGFPKSLNVGLAIDKAAGATRPVVGVNPKINVYEDGKNHKFYVGDEGNPAYGPAKVTAPATELAKQWDGYGTALKPAFEPIILARKPLEGTVAENVAKWGVGGLAIDACRMPTEENLGRVVTAQKVKSSYSMHDEAAYFNNSEGKGRWPANVCLDEDAAAQLDASVAPTKSVPFRANDAEGAVLPMKSRSAGGYADSGGPSRFYYCAKVSTKEREHGCDSLPKRSAGEATEREDGSAGLDSPRAGAGRTGGARNHHPTLKPLALNRWLASLIKPPTKGATLLVPYSGAGSEIIGALQAGWPYVFGIEGEADYIAIAEARIAAWAGRKAA